MKPKLNNKIDYSNIKKKFEKSNYVVIEDFLDEKYAEELYNFLNYEMPLDWWYSVSLSDKDQDFMTTRNLVENKYRIIQERLMAERTFNKGDFSYHFYRTLNDHIEECTCRECEFRKWVVGEEFLKALNKMTGMKFTRYATLFASKYSEGCFLSPHTDESNGDIGFVLQLTKDWLPQWGGLLTFLNDDCDKITDVKIPKFNALTLFKLPDQKGKWHYVSHVNQGVKKSRIAITGWFV
ncbi:MAG: 2OG-Fe(II) oxygenase [Candidatus Woesearchaeota archaeon]